MKLIPKHQKGDYMQTSTGKVANFQLPEVEVTAKSPTGDAWKDRNLYKAYKGRRYISEGRQKAKPLALGLAGLTALPGITAIAPAVSAILNNPYVNATLTADGVRNALSGEGVQKTYKLAKEGDYWGAAKSGVVDALDLLGGYRLLKTGTRALKLQQSPFNLSSQKIQDVNSHLQGEDAVQMLAKAGNKWARAKILSKEIDKSNIVANSLLPKPTVRTKVGDIEIDNPSLYYRQGSKEMADDFLETGIVDTDGAYSNPMFAQGHLWYGIPKILTNRKNTEIVTKRGLKFDLGKRNEDVAKTHLLVSNPSTDMIGANHRAHAANTLIYKQRNSPISDSDLIKYEQNLGKDFVSKYQDAYYNGDLEDRMATIVTYPGGSRRIPAIKGAANKSNTQLYEYNPNYGYRLIQNNSKTYNFNQNYNKNTQPGN